jgi:hypothetical protein
VLEIEAGVDDRLVNDRLDLAIRMRDLDVVNQGAGIGTRQDKRDFADDAVRNLLGPLDERVGEDRQRLDVLMLHQRLRVLPLSRLVEEPVHVRTFGAMLQDSVPEDILGRIVTMLPDQRKPISVLPLECPMKNGAPV